MHVSYEFLVFSPPLHTLPSFLLPKQPSSTLFSLCYLFTSIIIVCLSGVLLTGISVTSLLKLPTSSQWGRESFAPPLEFWLRLLLICRLLLIKLPVLILLSNEHERFSICQWLPQFIFWVSSNIHYSILFLCLHFFTNSLWCVCVCGVLQGEFPFPGLSNCVCF